MKIQEIIAFSVLILSIYFLYKKFFGKKQAVKNCGSNDCGCH